MVLRCLEYARSCQCSETGKTEASTFGSSRKIWMLDMWANFSPSGKKPKLRVSFQYYGTMLKARILVRGYLAFSYQLQCGWFYVYPKCRSLSSSFWISHKMNLSMYSCWIGISTWGIRVQGFLFHHLSDVNLSAVFLCNSNEQYKNKTLNISFIIASKRIHRNKCNKIFMTSTLKNTQKMKKIG